MPRDATPLRRTPTLCICDAAWRTSRRCSRRIDHDDKGHPWQPREASLAAERLGNQGRSPHPNNLSPAIFCWAPYGATRPHHCSQLQTAGIAARVTRNVRLATTAVQSSGVVSAHCRAEVTEGQSWRQ